MESNDKPIISFPLLPGDDSCLSMGDSWLFHYTTAEGFFKIIKSLKLKTSRLEKLNDLNEINNEAYSMMPIPEMVKYKEYVERRCSVACFSHHTLYPYRDHGYFLVPGCCNPSMWAHYAGNVSGVCLCLDRNKLYQENKEIFGEKVELQEVRYDTMYNPFRREETCAEFLNKNKSNIFFLKDVSWQNESEIRLLLTDIKPEEEEPMISIAESLTAIVFSQKFWKNNKNEFIEEVIRPNSFLGKMCPIYWLMLTSNDVAYDVGPGFPLDFEMELNNVEKQCGDMYNRIKTYKRRLQQDYRMNIV